MVPVDHRKNTGTAIVGLVERATGDIYMGADSATVGVSSLWIDTLVNPKVFTLDARMVLGFTSSWRMGQLLQFGLTLPPRDPAVDLFRWMVVDFVDAVRGCLKKGGWKRVENEREEGGTFLAGIEGRLFEIEDDFQVAESTLAYAACGCGYSLALGALYALEQSDLLDKSDKAVKVALAAAERFSAGVSGPFVVERLKAVR